jgi:hypothetical protein
MIVEAILAICLNTPINDWKGDLDSGPTCVYMNTGNRTFDNLNQCIFWVQQGKMEVSTKEHRDALHRRLPWTTVEGAEPIIKGECRVKLFEEPYLCQDCDL